MTLVEQAQKCDLPVLITGETGVGKEVLANEIQAGSARKDKPYVKINCAALPDTLVESTLFGHKAGSFTDAKKDQTGKFEQAHGGTIVLDEIGDLPLLAQAKLLRVTENGQIEKLGGQELKVDVRIIALTNKCLPEAIAAKLFRQDLYYRLAVLEIKLLPLRERLDEIPALVQSLTKLEVTPEALGQLKAYHWPGNIRELKSVVQRAELVASGVIREFVLGETIRNTEAGLRKLVKDTERLALVEALEKSDYVQCKAARLLGVPNKKVNDLIRTFKITHPSWRRNKY